MASWAHCTNSSAPARYRASESETTLISGLIARSMGLELLMGHGVTRGSDETDFFVHNYLDGHRLQQRLHAALVGEGVKKNPGAQFWQDFRSDAAAEEHAPGRKHPQRQIAGLRAVCAHKHILRARADSSRFFHAVLGDDRRWVGRSFDLGSQPVRLGLDASVAKEIVNVLQPRSGNDALAAHVPELLHEVHVQLNFQVIAWRKIRMAAFPGKSVIPASVPVHAGLAQAGSRGNKSRVALAGRRGIESDQIVAVKSIDARGVGLHIAD